jgi:hypothetical protein
LGLHASPRQIGGELATSLADPEKTGSRDDRNDQASMQALDAFPTACIKHAFMHLAVDRPRF